MIGCVMVPRIQREEAISTGVRTFCGAEACASHGLQSPWAPLARESPCRQFLTTIL